MSQNQIPKGVIGHPLEYYSSGGDDKEWLEFEAIKHYTNAFIVQDGKILLGYKKRGFGKDKYNGFGGKVEPGETPLEAAQRELQEEAGITAPLQEAGSLFFTTKGAAWAFQIHIFASETYEGTPHESDEMRPEWFSISAPGTEVVSKDLPPIPYERMWETDSVWIPLLAEGRKFAGRADFLETSPGEYQLHKWWYGVSP